MEKLLNSQQQILEKIERVRTNFGKDSASRKTTEYLQQRIYMLENLWADFEYNNLQLLNFEDKSHEYFKRNIFDHVKSNYMDIHTVISEYMKENPTTSGEKQIEKLIFEEKKSFSRADEPKTKTSEDKSSFSRADELKSLQETNFRAFERVVRGIDVGSITAKWKLEDKLQTLQEKWRAIDSLHTQIDNLLAGSDYRYDERFERHERIYEDMKEKLNDKLNDSNELRKSTPTIEIPKFWGSCTQWPTFMDLFTDSIHNNPNLTNSQKMLHLKTKLRGEAEGLVKHLNISNENYLTCWEILVDRYTNVQLLFTTQIRTFMNQPSVLKQTAHELKRLHDVSKEVINAIQNLGVDISSWDPILVHIITEKLDNATYTSYREHRKHPKALPSFEELMKFIETKFEALEPKGKPSQSIEKPITPPTSTFKKPVPITSSQYQKPYQKPNQYRSFHTNYERKCPICNTGHILIFCKIFQAMASETKLKTLVDFNICKNCLYCHNDKVCNSKKRCKQCGGEHHTQLHDACCATETVTPASVSNYQQNTTQHIAKSTAKSNNVTTNYDEVLLPTILLKVQRADGTFMNLRALLDLGSQVTLITERTVQALGLQRHYHCGTVSGVGNSAKQSRGMVILHCQSMYSDDDFTTQALVMITVINNLPNMTFDNGSWPHLQNINLADPDYNMSGPVDILLDANVYSTIIREGIIRGQGDAPIAQLTSMGWVVYGKVHKTLNCNVTLNNLEEVSKFWEMEEISNNTDNQISDDDLNCERFYHETTTRLPDGRYCVRLPMIPNFEEHLGKSKQQAVAQLVQLEKRMSRDTQFSESYKNFIHEYLTLNHMVECENTTDKPSCFLPHHGVVRQESTTTKLRVVFNGSGRSQSGRSLNELMLCGPNLQKDLMVLLLTWRKFRFVYTADIEKFYRQIMIHTDDQKLQKIVWRDSPQESIRDYQLCTITYGTKAAPYLAMRTIKQLALDDGHKYPLAVDTLNNQLYVNDLLDGHNDIDIAKQTQQQLVNILEGGGFNLRKWASNDKRLLEHFSPEQISSNMVDFKHAQCNKTLGLQWNPCTDQFSFKHQMSHYNENKPITKRKILSEISKLYDPLGWLSPITVKGKILFQDVWKSGINWDDPVQEPTQTEWTQFSRDMEHLKDIYLPRHLGNTNKHVELHGFSDSSIRAFSCVIYCKTTSYYSEQAEIQLVATKTKLAPLNKEVSIPRLELCGALLLAKLMNKVKESLNGHDVSIYGYTDSMVVIGWLRGNSQRWKAYVANRVNQIVDVIPATQWKYLRSGDNPADIATRGMLPSQLIGTELWWKGPSWLKDKSKEQESTDKIPIPTIETRKLQVCVTQSTIPTMINELIHKYSNITKLIHVTCWIMRFVNKLRHRSALFQGMHLTTNELDDTYKLIIKHIQMERFGEEITQLKEQGQVRRRSNILNLDPFLDADGILRLGGRISRSQLSFNRKHPIILPNNHKLTELLIDQGHKTTLHGGARLTLTYLREKFWIIGGQNSVKKQLRKCVKCQRFNKISNNQLMADLPTSRVTPSKAFTFCGVDFTGNVEVKANKGRGIKVTKGYICVFICLSTKAIHLELVSDLSTQAFLGAFKRMCSRRGMPAHMYSDQGTNFIGAAKILKQEYREAMNQYINRDFLQHLTNLGIQWHFNAPAWPSAGGIWESAVRSMKYHLKRVIGDQKLTFEEFSTLLAQIEACLNSRPLTPLTEDKEDLEYLSPAHFLVGESLLSSPISPDVPQYNLRTRWQLIEKMHRDFWKKWSTEYLSTLQSRQKWKTVKRNLELNDIVVIKDENIPPAKWILGRVIELHPGRDGLVRVVTVRTKGGNLQRPIVKLTRLPIEHSQDEIKESCNNKENKKQDESPRSQRLKRRQNSGKAYLYATLLFLFSLILPSFQ